MNGAAINHFPLALHAARGRDPQHRPRCDSLHPSDAIAAGDDRTMSTASVTDDESGSLDSGRGPAWHFERTTHFEILAPAPSGVPTSGGRPSPDTRRARYPGQRPGCQDTSAETITVDDREVSLWTQDQVDGIDLNVDTELPIILPPVEVFDPDVFQWDAWPVRTWDGGIAEIDGWSILVGLSASRTPDEGPVFYTVSEWRYWFTDGERWIPGGLIFEREDALGSRQWAGSTRYDADTNRISFSTRRSETHPTVNRSRIRRSFRRVIQLRADLRSSSRSHWSKLTSSPTTRA